MSSVLRGVGLATRPDRLRHCIGSCELTLVEVRRATHCACMTQSVQPTDEANSESFREQAGPIATQLQRACQRPRAWLISFSLDDGVTRCCERCCKSATAPEEAYLWRWLLDPSVRGMACRISHSESCLWCHRNLTTRASPLARTSPALGRTLWSNLLFPDFLSVIFGRKASQLNNRCSQPAGRCEFRV